MHFAIGLFFFCLSVIVIVAFWRIFVPLALVALVLGGLFLAALLGAFKPAPPPTAHEIATQIRAACAMTPRSRTVSDEQCAERVRLDTDDADRAEKTQRLSEIAEKATRAKREDEQADRQRQAAEAERQRQAAVAEQQRQQQMQILWQAFLQTAGGDYASRLVKQSEQQSNTMMLIPLMPGQSRTDFESRNQTIIQQIHQNRADLDALWQHYYKGDWERNSVCFTNISASQSHACHPEWGPNVVSGTQPAPTTSTYKPETNRQPTRRWDERAAEFPYTVGGAWGRAIKAAQ